MYWVQITRALKIMMWLWVGYLNRWSFICPHLSNGDNNTNYHIGVLWEVKDTKHVICFKQWQGRITAEYLLVIIIMIVVFISFLREPTTKWAFNNFCLFVTSLWNLLNLMQLETSLLLGRPIFVFMVFSKIVLFQLRRKNQGKSYWRKINFTRLDCVTSVAWDVTICFSSRIHNHYWDIDGINFIL